MDNILTELEQDPELEPDAIYVTGLAEGKWILLMWLGCFIWTMTVCVRSGYQTEVDPSTFATSWGIPAWIAWGICLPWLVANIVTILFCFLYMKDGNLGEDDSDLQTPSGATDNA